MKVLYIDTSTSYLYAGIVHDNKLLCEVQKEFGQSLSQETLPEIAKLFSFTKIDPADINKIIVINGPGSFTGIRIGLTIAKVYAWSLKIPIITVSSLEAMAISSKTDSYHIAVLDARHNHIYAAIYDNKYQQILEPQYLKSELLPHYMKDINNYTIITNDAIELPCQKESYQPNILKIVNFTEKREAINPHAVNPQYLKLTAAEERKVC